MAETLVSPGVLARENDQSFITQQPVQVGAAIVGPTVKGPVEIPTIVTSYSDYQNRFGTTFESGSDTYTYLTSIAAYNYFQNGGNTLLVARVVTGSWDYASASIGGQETPTTSSLTIETLYQGASFNNTSSLLSCSALDSGSVNNIRWEIASSDTANGTFSLVVRQGNDNQDSKSVLETWTNLSLDPNQSNYVAAVIGDQKLSYNSTGNYIAVSGSYANASRYIRVASVDRPTPNYFDNAGIAKAQYTSSIPSVGSGSYGGSFSGGSGVNQGQNMYENISTTTQGLTAGCYDNMLDLLSNADDYRFNILLLPGLLNSTHTSQITTAISNAQSRGDNMVVVDPVAYSVDSNTTVLTEASSRNTSYAAMYWPWLQTIDPDLGKQVWVPASTMMGGVFAFNDNAGEPWFAPAGINRGGMGTVIRTKKRLTQSDRDTLYQGNINPIAQFPGTGVVVYGQKTLQKQASALDRVNVRRLLISLKSYISQVALNLIFEQNTAATRNNFLAQVNPYLESVQQRQGLYAFKVVMDDSNNTPDVIDRNQLVGAIYLQPTKTAEFIYLDFNILPTGATFPA